MPDAEKVYIPGPGLDPNGYVSVGTDAAILPTDAATPLSGFADLGFLDENGYTEAPARESNDIKAFGGVTVKSKQTSFTVTFKMAFLEMNANVLGLVYGPDKVEVLGSNVTVTGSSKELPECIIVVDTLLDDTTRERLVIPRAKITGIDEIARNGKDPVKFGVTIAALAYDGENNFKRYQSKIDPGQVG